MTNASCKERPRICVSGRTSMMPRPITSSMTSGLTTAPRVSNTACAQGFIFSDSEPGRYPSSCPPTAYKGRKTITLRCCRRSSTASSPAANASALLPVPARPPMDTMPMRGSSRKSSAIRCSALRPCTPNASRSPRTSCTRRSAVTRANALPRSLESTRPVLQGNSAASGIAIFCSS